MSLREGALVYHDESEMAAIDSTLNAEADKREKMNDLKWQIKLQRDKLKMLQERVVASSTASTNRQKLVEEMSGRLGLLTHELADTADRFVIWCLK